MPGFPYGYTNDPVEIIIVEEPEDKKKPLGDEYGPYGDYVTTGDGALLAGGSFALWLVAAGVIGLWLHKTSKK
jgi:hypothetical protein